MALADMQQWSGPELLQRWADFRNADITRVSVKQHGSCDRKVPRKVRLQRGLLRVLAHTQGITVDGAETGVVMDNSHTCSPMPHDIESGHTLVHGGVNTVLAKQAGCP